jgi:antitoxin (DNA-binding transcriptional repressor) of toxin-antitoxin stability system
MTTSVETNGAIALLVEQVERGEEVTITKHGKPVARIVALPKVLSRSHPGPEKMDEIIEGIRKLSEGQTLNGISIKELIEEGRRF